MATLEQEIIEKFQRLDKAAQRRVRVLIERETELTHPTTWHHETSHGWT